MSNISILILYGFLIVIFYLILHVLIITNCCNLKQTNGNREASISTSTQSVQRRIIRCIRIDSGNVTNIVGVLEERDRQGNIYTIHDESSRQQNRYNGVYCLESTVANAARVQAQREKDDKDLPSYEEVMRLSIATAAAESAGSAVRNLSSALPPAPPYNEINRNPSGGENDNAASCSATAASIATLSLAARNITNPVVVTMANTTTPTTTANSTSAPLTTSIHNV